MNESELIEIEMYAGKNEKILIETLSRIGISDKKNKILWPSVYLYKKDDKLYLAHFKTLLGMQEGGYSNFSEEDKKRLNSIAYNLWNWELIETNLEKIEPYDSKVFVLPYAEKKNWKISHKLRISY